MILNCIGLRKTGPTIFLSQVIQNTICNFKDQYSNLIKTCQMAVSNRDVP